MCLCHFCFVVNIGEGKAYCCTRSSSTSLIVRWLVSRMSSRSASKYYALYVSSIFSLKTISYASKRSHSRLISLRSAYFFRQVALVTFPTAVTSYNARLLGWLNSHAESSSSFRFVVRGNIEVRDKHIGSKTKSGSQGEVFVDCFCLCIFCTNLFACQFHAFDGWPPQDLCEPLSFQGAECCLSHQTHFIL